MERPRFTGLWLLPEAELWGFARQPDGDPRQWASGSLFNQPVGDPLLNPVDRVHVVLLDAYPLPGLEEPSPGWKGKTVPLLRRRSRHQLTLDVAGFSAEELSVRLEGRKLTVLGRHEQETEALDGCLRRETHQVRQELLLPPDADLEALTCALAHNGRLRIQAPRLQRTIPVSVERSPSEGDETDGGAEATTAVGGGKKLDEEEED